MGPIVDVTYLLACAAILAVVTMAVRNRRDLIAVLQPKRWRPARRTAPDTPEPVGGEQALQESNAKLRAVIDASPLPILAMDGFGAVTSWNPAAERLFGWSEAEVLGRFNPIIPRGSLDEVRTLFTRISNGESVTGHEAVRRCKDGTEIDVSVSAAPLRDGEGQMVGVISILVDIRPAKEAEEALRRSERSYADAYEREREAADRLRMLDAMKNTFLNAVSHELRTPLTPILGFAQTLESEGERLTADQRTSIAGRIADNARKLERLLTDLLDLHRLQRGVIEPRRRPVNVAVLVGRVLEGVETSLRRNVHLTAEPIVLDLDAAMIERVVENLLVNVERYTPDETQVWVTVATTAQGAVIEVADDGPGVPEELRGRIFEPFQHGPEAIAHSPGVGIGLSLVAEFAEAHGGRAEVTERPGGGAAFRVHLPTVDAPASPGLRIDPGRERLRREAS